MVEMEIKEVKDGLKEVENLIGKRDRTESRIRGLEYSIENKLINVWSNAKRNKVAVVEGLTLKPVKYIKLENKTYITAYSDIYTSKNFNEKTKIEEEYKLNDKVYKNMIVLKREDRDLKIIKGNEGLSELVSDLPEILKQIKGDVENQIIDLKIFEREVGIVEKEDE